MIPGWPDLVIGGIAAFFAWKGFRNGFVAELAGPVAVLVAIIAAFQYPGTFDDRVAAVTHLGPGSAHALGTVLFAIVVYAIVALSAWLIGRFAKLPGIGIVNAVAGAIVGGAKALLGAWAVLYVTLFFPLTPDLRSDLHDSPLAAVLVAPDTGVDEVAKTYLPWFVRPLLTPFFSRHHV